MADKPFRWSDFKASKPRTKGGKGGAKGGKSGNKSDKGGGS